MTAGSKKCKCIKGTSYVCSKACSNYGTDGQSVKKTGIVKLKRIQEVITKMNITTKSI